jgi:hypothetical protein
MFLIPINTTSHEHKNFKSFWKHLRTDGFKKTVLALLIRYNKVAQQTITGHSYPVISIHTHFPEHILEKAKPKVYKRLAVRTSQENHFENRRFYNFERTKTTALFLINT